MKISDLSIQRPVLATVMNLLIILLGLIAYKSLTVREYPNIDVPVVTVETIYAGANASIIESQVTQILEDSLSGIEGIDYMASNSRAEKSQITVYFHLDRDADAAASDVRDRVGRVRGLLPDDIEEPVVAKVEADAQPIIWLAFSSTKHTPLEVTEFADRRVKDPLQTLPGVASVRIVGERRYAMRIWLNSDRMAALHVTPADIEAALRAQNVEIPAGRIESTEREFTVLTKTDLRSENEFKNIIVRKEAGYLVRIADIASVEIGPEDERMISRFKGENAVALGVVKQSTANPLDVSSAVRELLPRIQANFPQGMEVNIAYDSSVFISRSIDAVYQTIIEAIILVALVIFLFLRDWRATLIPLVTIPVSLVGAFAMMQLFDFSINTLTLLAMVLAIGLVVDDAIVVLENIYRYIEEGMKPLQAAFKGMREIGFAVIAMTFTLAAVFAPVAFTPGRTGKLFTEFALTLAGAVIVSGFVAITLAPMLSSKLLKAHHNPGWFYLKGEQVLNALTAFYQKLLGTALRFNRVVAVLGLATIAAVAFMANTLRQELSPVEDRGVLIGFSIAPEGASIGYVDKYAKQIEGIYSTVPEQDRYFMIVGFPTSANSISFLGLRDWEERQRSTQEIAGSLMGPMFGGITGTMSFPMLPPSLGQSIVSRPVEFVVQTTGTYDELNGLVQQVMGAIYTNPMFAQPDVDLKLNKPELTLDVQRDKAADLGVGVSEIGRTLEIMMAGRDVTRFKKDGEQYDVIMQVADVDRSNPSDLSNIYVRSNAGEMIQLSNLVKVSETVAPVALNHFNKLKSATIQASLAPGVDLSKALAFVQDTVNKVAAEQKVDVQTDLGGQSREFRSSSDGLGMTFVLALLFIYLVLAAQFESFKGPLIIMLSVPPALLGALLTLKLTGGSMNVYSQIGLLTLIGLITKHGILIVEFANQLQETGKNKLDAVMEAAALRLRPILMTTAAMVLGAIPLAMATGAGAESRSQIGWVIVGGMSIGTLLTLFIVPAFYTLIAGKPKELAKPD